MKPRKPGPDTLRGNSVLYKMVQKTEMKKKLFHSFYDTSKLLKQMPAQKSKRKIMGQSHLRTQEKFGTKL